MPARIDLRPVAERRSLELAFFFNVTDKRRLDQK